MTSGVREVAVPTPSTIAARAAGVAESLDLRSLSPPKRGAGEQKNLDQILNGTGKGAAQTSEGISFSTVTVVGDPNCPTAAELPEEGRNRRRGEDVLLKASETLGRTARPGDLCIGSYTVGQPPGSNRFSASACERRRREGCEGPPPQTTAVMRTGVLTKSCEAVNGEFLVIRTVNPRPGEVSVRVSQV